MLPPDREVSPRTTRRGRAVTIYGAVMPDARESAVVSGAVCNICGSRGPFDGPSTEAEAEGYNAREGLGCGGCGSISRERALIYTLGRLLGEVAPLERWTDRRGLRLFETSGYRGHPPRLERLFDYYNTHYRPAQDSPAEIDGRTTADLEDLPYPSAFFDVALSAEVLEHVASIDRALRELHRVLTPTGFAVISVPYVHDWKRTDIRVHRWRGKDVFFAPREYHADDTLVYRIYGRDFLDQLSDVGFSVLFLSFSRSRHAIAGMDMIVASKAPYFDISCFLGEDEGDP